MKKHLKKVLAYVLLGVMLCCPPWARAEIKPLRMPEKPSMEKLDKSALTEDFIKDLSDFSAELAAAYVSQNEGENALISPLSVRYAFSALAEGADGETAKLLEQFLKAKLGEDYTRANLVHKLQMEESGNQDDSKFIIKDSLWIDQKLQPKLREEFVNKLADAHLAEIYAADKGADETAKAMDKWVSDATNGLIQTKHKADPNTLLTLMNTLYFKSSWEKEFNPNENYDDTFHPENGKATETTFMSQRFDDAGYSETDKYTIADLTFRNGYRFEALLPKEGTKLSDLLSKEQAKETIAALLTHQPQKTGKIYWSVPKYSFQSAIDLKQLISSMGYEDLFKTNANFKKLADADLFVSNAQHLTNFILDNQGVEAAAQTEISMEAASMPVDNSNEVYMQLNKPFLYTIKAPDGSVVFVGAMYKVEK